MEGDWAFLHFEENEIHQHTLKTSTTLPWPLLRGIWFNTLVLDLPSFGSEPLAARPAAVEPGPAPLHIKGPARAPTLRPSPGWGLLS